MTKSILLVGVGGQGTILASKILTLGLMEAGFDVKMSEIHGMSQRGGRNEKAANLILLVTIIKSMGLEHIDWESILRANIKPQFVDLNLKAIKVGMEAM